MQRAQPVSPVRGRFGRLRPFLGGELTQDRVPVHGEFAFRLPWCSVGISGFFAVGGAEFVDDPRQRTAVADGVVQGDGEDLLLALLVAYEEEPQGGPWASQDSRARLSASAGDSPGTRAGRVTPTSGSATHRTGVPRTTAGRERRAVCRAASLDAAARRRSGSMVP